MHDLNYNMDGKHWAEDFMERFGGDRRSEIDESLMLAWFCNAIMAGYGVGRSRFRKELGCDDPAALRAALEELRDAYVTACRDQPRSSLSGVCTRIENVIKLLPPKETTCVKN